MRRKILMGVLAIALPIGTLVGLSSAASAKNGSTVPADGAVNCTVSGSATFPAPGLSASGSISATSKTSVTTASASFGGCGGSSALSVNISSKNTKCKGANNPQAPCAVKKTYLYDTESGFATTGTTSIQKALKKITLHVGGRTYQTKTSAASSTGCTAPPPGPGGVQQETGFKIVGTVKSPKQDKGQTVTLIACLGADTGPGTTGSFTSDLLLGTGTIASATIDGATSTLSIS